jgi:hypothetical protein
MNALAVAQREAYEAMNRARGPMTLPGAGPPPPPSPEYQTACKVWLACSSARTGLERALVYGDHGTAELDKLMSDLPLCKWELEKAAQDKRDAESKAEREAADAALAAQVKT